MNPFSANKFKDTAVNVWNHILSYLLIAVFIIRGEIIFTFLDQQNIITTTHFSDSFVLEKKVPFLKESLFLHLLLLHLQFTPSASPLSTPKFITFSHLGQFLSVCSKCWSVNHSMVDCKVDKMAKRLKIFIFALGVWQMSKLNLVFVYLFIQWRHPCTCQGRNRLSTRSPIGRQGTVTHTLYVPDVNNRPPFSFCS